MQHRKKAKATHNHGTITPYCVCSRFVWAHGAAVWDEHPTLRRDPVAVFMPRNPASFVSKGNECRHVAGFSADFKYGNPDIEWTINGPLRIDHLYWPRVYHLLLAVHIRVSAESNSPLFPFLAKTRGNGSTGGGSTWWFPFFVCCNAVRPLPSLCLLCLMYIFWEEMY